MRESRYVGAEAPTHKVTVRWIRQILRLPLDWSPRLDLPSTWEAPIWQDDDPGRVVEV